MQTNLKRGLLGALALSLLVVMSGCTTNDRPIATTAPTVAITVAPTTPPTATESATVGTMSITVDGKVLTEKGVNKDNVVWLPLEATAKALGYTVEKGQGGATVSEWTLTKGTETVKATYQLSSGTISSASIAKVGASTTATDPLMMQSDVLFASEKVFSDVLGAKVTADVAGNQVTVDKATTGTTT